MRTFFVVAAATLCGCAPAPPPAAIVPPDAITQPWYAPTVHDLATLNTQARDLFQRGKFDEAAAAITKGQPLQSRLLEAVHPPLEAMEAVSDLDELYGRMLLRNSQVGWARTTFQKNVTRWKHWKPESPRSAERLRAALAAVAECDRRLAE